MATEPNPELWARLGEIMPNGNWVTAMADEDGVRARLDSLREVAWPDLEIAMVGPGGFTGVFHGIDGFREAWDDWLRPFDRYAVEIEELRVRGKHLVALARHEATPKGTEATVEGTAAAVMTLRDGRLARIEFNLDRDAALRAAGLEE
jgi:ketosteroid isomerase-like protein